MRPCSPTRSRCGRITPSRARSSATPTSARRRSGGSLALPSRWSWRPRPTAGIAGPPARSPRPPTTSTAPTASAGQAARSGPTATAWPTCSPTSSPTAPPATASSSCPPSTDGGRHWTKARPIFPATDLCNAFEPSIGRCVEDGIGGARDDLGPSPSVDIANGAPTGADATNQIVDAWADGRDGLNNEHVMFSTSTNGGATWTSPRIIESAGDRGYYAAPAISPNGTDVWVVYNAFTTPFRNDTSSPRNLVGVV